MLTWPNIGNVTWAQEDEQMLIVERRDGDQGRMTACLYRIRI